MYHVRTIDQPRHLQVWLHPSDLKFARRSMTITTDQIKYTGHAWAIRVSANSEREVVGSHTQLEAVGQLRLIVGLKSQGRVPRMHRSVCCDEGLLQ